MIQNHIAKLERDGDALLELARIYVDRYPPDKTSKDVLNAVTVPVPLPTFLSLLVVAYKMIPAHKGDDA
jgi:hypothetical protein